MLPRNCCTIKTLAVENFGEFGELQQFTKFFAKFHNFQNIPYANGLQFAKVFSAKLPIILGLLCQTFYCQKQSQNISVQLKCLKSHVTEEVIDGCAVPLF